MSALRSIAMSINMAGKPTGQYRAALSSVHRNSFGSESGTVIWRCTHIHTTANEARACATSHGLKSIDSEDLA